MIIDLAKVFRKDKLESIHYGIACHIKEDEILNTWGDIDFKCFTRSIIKPIQTKVSLSILGENLEDKFIAVATASHTCEPLQLELIYKLAEKFALFERQIQVGLEKNKKVILDNRFEHNCAGKHLLMLAAAKKQGFHLDDYLKADHPIQEAIEKEIKHLLGKNTEIEKAIDGCGLPTYYLSIKEMAKLFLGMLKDSGYQKIFKSMNEYPLIVGGENQIDSLLMYHHPGKFIAKGGAEGLMMVVNLEKRESLVIKIIDGSHRAKPIVTKALLEKIGWIEEDSFTIDTQIYNSHSDVIGEIKASIVS